MTVIDATSLSVSLRWQRAQMAMLWWATNPETSFQRLPQMRSLFHSYVTTVSFIGSVDISSGTMMTEQRLSARHSVSTLVNVPTAETGVSVCPRIPCLSVSVRQTSHLISVPIRQDIMAGETLETAMVGARQAKMLDSKCIATADQGRPARLHRRTLDAKIQWEILQLVVHGETRMLQPLSIRVVTTSISKGSGFTNWPAQKMVALKSRLSNALDIQLQCTLASRLRLVQVQSCRSL